MTTTFLEAVLWIAGVFERIFDAVSEDPEMEFAMVDGPSSKFTATRRRKRGTENQAIEKSKGGWTTKIPALTDAQGNLVRFVLLLDHRFDTVGVAPQRQRIRRLDRRQGF